MKNLFFGVCIAPYRIDLYNYLHNHFNCDIYFQYEKLQSQNYNMQLLYEMCSYKPNFLKIKMLGGKRIAIGLKNIVKENNPSYIFVPEFSILTIQILLIKYLFNYKFKIISVCDDSYDMIMGNDFSKQHRIARRIITPFLDNLMLVDNRVRDWYQKKYKKGTWMPIISDEKRMRNIYKELLPLSKVINRKYNLEGQKVILFVGRLVGLKNVSKLIEAYAPLKNMAKLVIIGDGECRNDLEIQNEKLETNLIFAGRKEGNELLAWYNIADIFVLPSTQEPFGAVTNEALLAGCFSLISEKAGSSSIIIPGINGFVFDPYSIDNLTELLQNRLKQIESKTNIIMKENLMQYYFEDSIKKALSEIE